MGDRFLLWLGAGAVCAGVTVGMLAGAGTAVAQTESDGDGGAKTSQSAKPAENKQDSGKRQTPASARGTSASFGSRAAKAIDAVRTRSTTRSPRSSTPTGGNDRATVAESSVRTTETGPNRASAPPSWSTTSSPR